LLEKLSSITIDFVDIDGEFRVCPWKSIAHGGSYHTAMIEKNTDLSGEINPFFGELFTGLHEISLKSMRMKSTLMWSKECPNTLDEFWFSFFECENSYRQ